MNHQVQTSLLVDNEWVTRTVDAYQFMAQGRQSDAQVPEPVTKAPSHVPEYGILSRTAFVSPLFKSIRPANIRHKDHNDVVFVGQDTLQLHEIQDYARLRHVATKSDFKGCILAARVFGDPREIPVSVASPVPKKPALHRGRRSMTGDEEQLLPPEVIVLTLTSRTLMFLWARHTQTGAVSFSQRTIRLPAGASRFDRFGAFLAIDSARRAMAVAAQEGRFILYKTKSMQTWRRELRQGRDTTPIEDERIIAVQGRIMHMEFLSSRNAQDEFHVVLLFVIAFQGMTKMTCFDWDCREDLSTAAVRTERVAVNFYDHNPSLVIPLGHTSDVLLVLDTHIATYKDVLSGDPKRRVAKIDDTFLPSLRPGDSKRRPRWVEWDKAPRNPDYPKEAFYVAREDGQIMCFESTSFGPVEISHAGNWPYRIDTAFACLTVDNSESTQSFPDVIIAGGAGNDGCLYRFGPWPTEYPHAQTYTGVFEPVYLDSISNWTPLTDLSVARLSGHSSLDERDRYSLLVANGASPQGEITELRHGLKSIIDHSFGGMNGCMGIWIIDYGRETLEIEGKATRQYYATFAVTIPPETLILRITRNQGEFRGDSTGAWENGVWKVDEILHGDELADVGVLRGETMTACCWSENFSVQVSRDDLRILHRPSLIQSDSTAYANPLLLAASRPGFPFIAISFREAGKTYLEMTRISSDGKIMSASCNTKMQLDHDPTCLELFKVNGTNCIFVSTFSSTIHLLKVNEDGTLESIVEDSLAGAALGGAHMVIESAVLLTAGATPALVCSTRSGHLLISPLFTHGADTTNFAWRAVKLGTTSARLNASTTDPSVAFASCGPDFCRVRCSAIQPPVLDIDSVWFTHRKRPGYFQSSVTAMCQLPFDVDATATVRNLGGFMFAVAGDEFLCSQLDADISRPACDASPISQDDRGAVPRKLFTGAKPTNVTYLKAIRKIVVTTMEAREERAPPNGYRVLHSAIKLLDTYDNKTLEDAEVKQEEASRHARRLVAAEYELRHGERVYSVAEWAFTDHRNRKFTLIIVGTGVPGSTGKGTGRRLIFNVGKNESHAKLHLLRESTFDQPVYCTAVFSNASTVSAIGKTLTLDVFDSEAGVLRKHATIELPSPGTHITIRAPYIYVSTLQHSHYCFLVVEDMGKTEFKRIFTDSRERSCSTHLVLGIDTPNFSPPQQDTLVLVNDKNTASITALFHAPQRTHKNAAHTLFEAHLPRTVIRLQQGDIRPPWRRPIAGSPTGIINDEIIGACSDGTMYTFSILSEPARHMLRLVQNLITEKDKRNPEMQHTPISSRRTGNAITDILMHGAEGNQDERIRALDVDPRQKERGQAGARFKHIDGDLVGRWLVEDGDVMQLVSEGTESNVGSLFGEFAVEMWGLDGTGGDEELVVQRVREWLREVFMAVL
ncbi:mono-functional DNA-alkylating methyl methanesulfonate N-term-domain-containing protein [Ampelomyces quisqualis]|uniref:Mono-functional DNA-alkylating methyl methanesulfonate N-term-domain-containing protein n=1 Tax=Ampelomyces quisqualis TaxID=50730 RepID=A0A6A5QD93_AMPQU|nr:mono-functional DNA-alkylating methyl methanesulfonate N-term-domain-containing protein [Ampelomyces quisqualis]